MEPASVPSSGNTYALIPMPHSPWLESLRDDPQRLFSTEMIVVHNCFIRGLNSMLRTAPLVKPKDEDAFIGQAQVKTGIEHNIEQHEAILPGMEALKEYFQSMKAKKEKYDGLKVRILLEAFAGTLTQHLHDEIETITPERFNVLDKEGFRKMLLSLEDHIKKQPSKSMVWPFIATHHDISVAPNWPPASATIRWFIRNIAPLFHRSYWKFSPFHFDGSPRALYGSDRSPSCANQITQMTGSEKR